MAHPATGALHLSSGWGEGRPACRQDPRDVTLEERQRAPVHESVRGVVEVILRPSAETPS